MPASPKSFNTSAAATLATTVVEVMPSAPSQHALLDILRNTGEPLFALLDAARDPQVLEVLRESEEEYQSLYEGVQGEVLAEFAPYLIRLPKESGLLQTLVQQGWGRSWGVYLTCARPFNEVRRHFRHFLLVESGDAKQLYFRFYDPRVLRVFLPTCTPQQIREFFGWISSFITEGEAQDELLKFLPGGPGLTGETLRLS